MVNKDLLLRYDFQGWPLYKVSWREILNKIGKQIDSNSYKFDNDVLDTYPGVYEDDGMGYCTAIKNICLVENADRIWIDLKTENNEQS